MDFSPLTSQELKDFLSLNGIEVDYDWEFGNNRHRLVQQASDLFDRLSSSDSPGFTLPVADFYVASLLKSSINEDSRYDRSSFDQAGPEELEDYALQMGLPLSDNLKERIIRVLDYLKVLSPVTFGQLLRMLSNATIYYQIMINPTVEVDGETTEDQLYRHVLEDFGGIQTTGYTVKKEDELWFLVLEIDVNTEDVVDDMLEVLDNPDGFLATRELLLKILPNVTSPEGKLTIPRVFTDRVVTEHNPDQEYLENVEFKFSRIVTDDPRLLDYLEPF